MKSKRKTIDVSYPLPLNEEYDDAVCDVAKDHYGQELGSGAGFGFRDHDFSFSAKRADQAYKAFKALPIKGIEVSKP